MKGTTKDGNVWYQIRLKDHNGYHVYKYKDDKTNKRLFPSGWEYFLCDPEEDEIIDVYSSLRELKEAI